MSDGRATPGTVSERRLLTHVHGSPPGRCSASSLDAARLVLPPRAQALRTLSVLPHWSKSPDLTTCPQSFNTPRACAKVSIW